MIFTVRVRDDEGQPLETVTDDPTYQTLLKGKQIFYVLSTALDGPLVTKFGIAHDASPSQLYTRHLGASGEPEAFGGELGRRTSDREARMGPLQPASSLLRGRPREAEARA